MHEEASHSRDEPKNELTFEKKKILYEENELAAVVLKKKL